MYKKSPAKIIGIGVFIVVTIFAFGFVTMSLWNALIPELFNGPMLTYWQAVGLLILSRLLLPGGHSPRGRHSHSHSRREWKARFKNRHETPVETVDVNLDTNTSTEKEV